MIDYKADPKFWQRFLKCAGFYKDDIDGDFGPKSMRAAHDFEQASVRNCFDALEHLFYELSESPKGANGSTVVNIATIVGTWARNITPDTDSRDPGKPFPTFALETAKRWGEVLRKSKAKSDWTQALSTLDGLIERASKSRSAPAVQALVSPS